MKSLYKKIQKYSVSILILLSLLLSITLLSPNVMADVQTGIPAIINGLKTFTGGIRIGTDPNNAWLSNGNITARSIYSNGSIVPILDANSLLPVANTPDLHTNLTSSSLILTGGNITVNSLNELKNSVTTPADPNTPITTIKIVSGWGVVKCGVEKQHFSTDPNGTVTYDYKTLNSSNTKDTASNLNVYNDANMALCFQNKTADPNSNIKYEIKY